MLQLMREHNNRSSGFRTDLSRGEALEFCSGRAWFEFQPGLLFPPTFQPITNSCLNINNLNYQLLSFLCMCVYYLSAVALCIRADVTVAVDLGM
jgi:hypothetical protein